MNPKTTDIDRRTVLKTAGGAAATLTVGGAGFAALSGSAAATAVLDVSIADTSYSGDQGLVDWLGVEVDKTLQWDGFDVPLRYIGFKHEITLDNATAERDTPYHVLYDDMSGRLSDWSTQGSGSDGWGGPGEYIASHNGDKADYLKGEAHADIKWAIISNGGHPSDWASVQTPVDWTDILSVDSDGATDGDTVKWRSTLTFYTEDGDGNPVQVAEDDGVPSVTGEDTFVVDVTNEESDTSGSTEDGTSTAG